MAGFIGSRASVVSSGAERKQHYNITTTTTSLTGLQYTPTKVHVYHNGIRLVDGTDYTATNGTSITLTNAAEDGDDVVVVSYATFQVSDTVSAANGGTFAGNVTVSGDLNTSTVLPSSDDAKDLGTSAKRFQDLYLSGGVYLGGTGSANYLDDYEEGTWTPTVIGGASAGTGTYTTQAGKYTIVGNTVFISVYLVWTGHTGTGTMIFELPFTPNAGSLKYSSVSIGYTNSLNWGSGSFPSMHIHPSSNQLYLGSANVSGSWSNASVDSAASIIFAGHYHIA